MDKDNQHIISRPEKEISITDLIENVKDGYRFFMRKKTNLIFVGIVGCLLGTTYAYFRKPIYTAASTFVLEEGDKSGGLGQYAGLASMIGMDLGGGGGLFQGDNIVELYRSRTMIQKTLLSFSDSNSRSLLIDSYIRLNNLQDKWRQNLNVNEINFLLKSGETFSRTQDSLIGKAVEDINKDYLYVTKPDKKLNILRVEVKSTDEYFSKNFNDQIVKNVNDFYVSTKTKRSLQNINILQRKTDSVRNLMNLSIKVSSLIADATPNLNPTRQTQRVAPIQRSQFNAETNKAVLSELIKNLEMSKISLLKETPLIQMVDSPILPLDKSTHGYVKYSILFGILTLILYILSQLLKKIWKRLSI